MIYEETSGTSPDPIYGTGMTSIFSAWGFSWANSWGFSWGNRPPPIYGSSNNAPGDPFETNSGSGPFLYNQSSGNNPDPIYEEN